MFIINWIMTSLSLGADSATSSASAASPTSLITISPLRNRRPLRCRKSTNRNAPMRLLPSEKGWFLTTKYSRCAAFDSMVGYAGSPKTLCSRLPSRAASPSSRSKPNRSVA